MVFTGFLMAVFLAIQPSPAPLSATAAASSLVPCMEEAAVAELLPAADGSKRVKCLDANEIENYEIVSDKSVRFALKDGRSALVVLQSVCGDLLYHHYISYVPMNGKLCVNRDELVTREGIHCKIKTITLIEP